MLDKLIVNKTKDCNSIKLTQYWAKKLSTLEEEEQKLFLELKSYEDEKNKIDLKIKEQFTILEIVSIRENLKAEQIKLNKIKSDQSTILMVLILLWPLAIIYYFITVSLNKTSVDIISNLQQLLQVQLNKLKPLEDEEDNLINIIIKITSKLGKINNKIIFIESDSFKQISGSFYKSMAKTPPKSP